MEKHGGAIEYDLHDRFPGAFDLLDWFRGKYSWCKLYRILEHLPPDSEYQSSRAMDFELAQMIIDAEPKPDPDNPRPAPEPKPLSPAGFTQERLLQMATVEAVRNLNHTLSRVYGGKGAPPMPYPRPTSAYQILDSERDRLEVDDVLRELGVQI